MSNSEIDKSGSSKEGAPAGGCAADKHERQPMEAVSEHIAVLLDGAEERRAGGERGRPASHKPSSSLEATKIWRRLVSTDETACEPPRDGSQPAKQVRVDVEAPLAASSAAGSTVDRVGWPEERQSSAQEVISKSSGSDKANEKRARQRAKVGRPDKGEQIKWSAARRKASVESELRNIATDAQVFDDMQKQMLLNLKYDGRPAGSGRPASCGQMKRPLEELGPLPRAAIECRQLNYQVGLGGARKRILRDLWMTVPEGAIYGLLGPSGCGKTTLLRCVAGRLEPAPGSHLRVFGFRPNTRGAQIPGPAIGYMPQEVSIYEEFTIRETLAYFGLLSRMEARIRGARIDFLLRFLHLPTKRRLIKTLSGGQQRRVSLAVALVHAPPLLILDEPTVGVDPLLRQTIWNYLVSLAARDKTSIVITTHYIEEARQAHIVGMMRDGRLLAENEPSQLMYAAGSSELESVFLKLCASTGDQLEGEDEIEAERRAAQKLAHCRPASAEQQAREDNKFETGSSQPSPNSSRQWIRSESNSGSERHTHSRPGEHDWRRTHISRGARQFQPMEPGDKYDGVLMSWSEWFVILAAVIWKNMLRLRRNPPVLVFEFLLPALQMLLFGFCIGGPPFDIPLAVVNEELAPSASRMFLDSLSPVTFRQEAYENLSAALDSVRAGHSWAAVHFPERYTHSLHERLLHPAELENGTVANATITIYPDLTNLHLALVIEGAFKEAFVRFARHSLDLLGYDSSLAGLPVRLGAPIYGRVPSTSASASTSSGYLDFMAPGVVISITYVMATGLTALAFILEKRDGLLERSQMAGVSSTQILLAHALLQVLVMALQIVLVLAVTFLVFQVPCEGSLLLAGLLVMLQGCAGMAFGLLISAVCREENTAIMMLVGTFYINLILAGIMWPIEAMPKWLRPISFAQPQTLAIMGLRDIMARGWSLAAASVQLAFITSTAWLLIFLIGAALCMRHIK